MRSDVISYFNQHIHMQKQVFFLVVFLLPLSFLLAQNSSSNKCKYEIDEVDRFSKVFFKQTQTATLWKGIYKEEIVRVAAVNDNGQRGIAFSFIGPVAHQVSETDSLLLLLGDTSIVTLSGSITRKVEPFSEDLWHTKVLYPITKAQYQDLVVNNIEVIRQYTEEGYIEQELKGNKREKIRGLLMCIQ